jgi:alkyldihydroxyacetonephosphate synthase
VSETDLPVVELRRPRWGNPRTPEPMPSLAAAALEALGAHPRAQVRGFRVPDSALGSEAMAALTAVVGAGHVVEDADTRVQHTRGYSTPDLLRLWAGDVTDAPDAVIYPADHDEVIGVLKVCAEHRIAVVPFAGGTSVVGGLTPARAGFTAVVVLDVRRMDRLLALDEISRTATLQAGVRGPRAEELLRASGFTLGHFPQSYEGASIGGYAAARSAGQSSAGYGRFDEMVVGLALATPQGMIELGTAPRSAAGPDLRQLVLGSEGVFGVITSVTVRIRPVPAYRAFEGWRFASFEAGADALRALAQDGPLPTVLRLSDEMETAVNFAVQSGCLAVTGYEGTATEAQARRAAASAVLAAHGGTALGSGPGEEWRESRFRGPYLRDPILEAGGLVETLETATFWSRLSELKAAVTAAITGSLGESTIVLCHISHVYETGASLYFTVLAAQDDDPLAQWAAAKQAASNAIRSVGATITHHHGVGTDHRDTYHAEVGPLAVAALRAVKQTLDPDGILNPGVLI